MSTVFPQVYRGSSVQFIYDVLCRMRCLAQRGTREERDTRVAWLTMNANDSNLFGK